MYINDLIPAQTSLAYIYLSYSNLSRVQQQSDLKSSHTNFLTASYSRLMFKIWINQSFQKSILYFFQILVILFYRVQNTYLMGIYLWQYFYQHYSTFVNIHIYMLKTVLTWMYSTRSYVLQWGLATIPHAMTSLNSYTVVYIVFLSLWLNLISAFTNICGTVHIF
jgi:hypothetical protein